MQNQTQSLGLVALGANLPSSAGMPKASLQFSLRALAARGVELRAVSRFWQTPAFPAGSGPDYLNAAAVVATDLPPWALLDLLHRIEAQLGRKRDSGRWQARGVDLDLLALGGQVLPDAATQDRWRALPPDRQQIDAPDRLILPHPRMQDRAFVLVPLAEVAPDWLHPRLGLTVRQMRDALPAQAFTGMFLAQT